MNNDNFNAHIQEVRTNMKVSYSIDVTRENIILSFSELNNKDYQMLLSLLETMKKSDYEVEEITEVST